MPYYGNENATYRWRVAGRYEYWAIDLYMWHEGTSERGDWLGSESIIIPRLSKKAATEICNKLNMSLSYGGKLHFPADE